MKNFFFILGLHTCSLFAMNPPRFIELAPPPYEEQKKTPIKDPAPEHLSASHTEGKGLGYSKGYSSLDLFLSQPFSNKKNVLFLDGRGHLFNSGKWAANGGLGFRRLMDCTKKIWGANLFYDYYQTSQRPYNQAGAGLEVLAEKWDVRVNGYVPVGHKRTNIYRFEYESFGTVVVPGEPDLGLPDLELPGFRMKAREQFAMKAVDSLVGYRFCKTRSFNLNLGAGPYYLWGNTGNTEDALPNQRKNAFGGRFKVKLAIWNYLMLEGVTTYDHIFRWTGQGTITLNLPFNFTYRQKNTSKCPENSYCLMERLYQPVERNEIVVVDSLNRFSSCPQILDPDFEP